MNANVKRAGKRIRYEAPIIWGNFNTEDYYQAKTYNYSESGIYFETDYAPKANANICIKPLNYLPNTNGPEAYQFYEAKVKWYRHLSVKEVTCYGIGAQYLIKSQTIDGPDYPCSLCGENISYGKIHSIDDFVYLCSHCFKHYQLLPDGMIKKSIKDFLIGNVI